MPTKKSAPAQAPVQAPARERQLELKFQQMRDNPEQYFEKARQQARRAIAREPRRRFMPFVAPSH